MSYLRPVIHEQSPRHRSVASGTSGVTDSTISYASTSTTNETLHLTQHLSQFPSPPPSNPATPLRTEFPPSPPRSDSSPVSPVSSGMHSAFRWPPSDGIVPLVPKGKLPTEVPSTNDTSVGRFSSQPIVKGRPNYVPPSLLSPVSSSFSRPLPPPPEPLSSKSSRPIAWQSSEKEPSVISNASLSPYDWHEGSSTIGLDPAEDRLLSTSFITTLLSSTDDSSADEHGVPPPRRDRRNNHHPVADTDAMSAASEMTYPPSSRFGKTPSPEYYVHSPNQHTSPPQPQGPRTESAQRRRPPPTSYMPVGNVDRSSKTSYDDDSETVHGGEHNRASVVRTASMSRGLGARGASVVGIAPAILRKVSITSSGQNTVQGPRADASSDGDKRGSGRNSSQGDYYRDSGGNKLRLPELVGPSSFMHSPALPSTAGTQQEFPFRHHSRQSVHSTKSTKSYVSSLISRMTNGTSGARSARSVKQAFSWLRKPLPPVPMLPHIPIAIERQHRLAEDTLPLPDLVNRAGALSQMLEKGYHPHRSFTSSPFEDIAHETKRNEALMDGIKEEVETAPRTTGRFSRALRPLQLGVKFRIPSATPVSPKIRPPKKMRHIWIIVAGFLIVLLIISIAVGVTESKKKHAGPNCSGNLTGATCSLDATCVCTSTISGQCGQLAQSLVTLTPTINTLFGTNLTANNISTALWQAQGNPTGANCASQAVLVDVAPGLSAQTTPNRTAWAQSALLWNLVESEDVKTATKMQQFVVNANWATLGPTDGPVPDSHSAFSMNASGYTFNFATQTVSQHFLNASFQTTGQPSGAQVSRVDDTARSALDRMYVYALASSRQRRNALSKYWQSVLQQKPQDLAVFLSTISASPILVPFDASSSPGGQAITNLLTNSTTAPFPPPLACYPGLNSTPIALMNTIETSIFGLSGVSATSQFNPSCFADRPLYGVLDVLQLRLPFIDSQTGVAKQAAVLSRDVAPRAVLYSGAMLSTYPSTPDPSTLTITQKDPRQYGTLNNLDHVILNYLTSISDVNVAVALVEFILADPATPPPNSTALFQSLASIPTLEVAVFGTVLPSDITSTVSSFTTPSGSLFFGSDQGQALRNWAISTAGSPVIWTSSATSPEVVRDTSLSDSNFLSVWDPVSNFLHSQPSGVTVNVGNITAAFQAIGKFTP